MSDHGWELIDHRAAMEWFERYRGRSLEDARQLAALEGRRIRVVGHDGVMTLDLDLGRLTVLLDEDGAIRSMGPG